MNPVHPVYVVSKSRWDTQYTSRFLSAYGVPHSVVVEEAQRARYEAVKTRHATILTLDPEYQRTYDTFDDLGLTKSVGPGAARNFAWDHAIASGASWHWVMDDNIRGFFRLNRNLKTPVSDGTILRVMEAFVERYENIAMAGPQYFMFAPPKVALAPFIMNTRIYSCNLIRNDVPYRWRGRYNEDTDLSLRMLKDNWCTVQFYAFLQQKLPTQTVKGGNHEDFYSREGTRPKSEMLARMHPDVATVVWRFRRWHHFVDYTGFRQELRPVPGLSVGDDTDNFGMVLEQLDTDGRWERVATPWTRDPGRQARVDIETLTRIEATDVPQPLSEEEKIRRYSVIPEGPPGSWRPSQPPPLEQRRTR